MGSDLRVVKERVDETNVRITSLSQEVEAMRVAIPSYPPPTRRRSHVDPGGGPGRGDAGAPDVPPRRPVPQTFPSSRRWRRRRHPPRRPVPGISPQRLYDSAWTDYTAGQWTLCIEGFNTYLRSFPRSEAADDAQFYIGECNFADGKYTEAMDAYNRVIANYPRADKAPDAYYKRGMTFERIGQLDRARESWETLLKTFPDAEVARLGKQNLDRLSRAKPGRDSADSAAADYADYADSSKGACGRLGSSDLGLFASANPRDPCNLRLHRSATSLSAASPFRAIRTRIQGRLKWAA